MIDLSSLSGATLSAVPEAIRGLFSVSADGKVSLDDTKIRTEADVSNVKKAKDMEVTAHNADKAELAKFKKLAETADELSDKISELESRGGNASEQTDKLGKLQKDYRAAQNEYATLKQKYDSIQPEFDKLKGESIHRKTIDLVNEQLDTIKDVDKERTRRMLMKDVATGYISLDDTGEALRLKDGSKISDYIETSAKDFGFVIQNNPGGSNPGKEHIPNTLNTGKKSYVFSETQFLDDGIIAQARL